MKKIAIVVGVPCLLTPHLAVAQYDSDYIAPFDRVVSAGISTYYQPIILSHKTEGESSSTYIPNTPVGIGLSFTYKNISLAGGIEPPFFRNPDYGKTTFFALQAHYYGRKFLLDLFFSKFRGFYFNKGETVFLYPDIRLIQYGISGQYIFNHRNFSYKAAFNHSERQLKSAGSFQLGGGIYYNQVSADTSLVLNEQNALNNYQIGVTGGYVYTFVIKSDFFATVGVSVGINAGTEKLGKKEITLSPNAYPRIAVGYHANTWSIGLSCAINRTYIPNHETSSTLVLDTIYAQMLFTKRFGTDR